MRLGSRQFWLEGHGSLVLAILIALFIRWMFIEAYVIPSGSMLPSLLINDHIFVNKLVYGVRVPFSEKWMFKFKDPKRGEVIVFKYPGDMSTFYIKRIAAVGGDTVELRDGVLKVNNVPVKRYEPVGETGYSWLRPEDFAHGNGVYTDRLTDYDHFIEENGGHKYSVLDHKYRVNLDPAGPEVVPEGHLYMIGDNRDNSADSRMWNFLPVKNVLGRAMFVWLSCEETLPVVTFLCSPLSLRWGRFFHYIHSEPAEGYKPMDGDAS